MVSPCSAHPGPLSLLDSLKSPSRSVVRIVPDELHVQDSQFYDTLYTKAGRVDKYDWMAGRFGCDTSVFTTSPDELHRIRRGVLNPLFSRARIVDLETLIRQKVNILLERISEFQAEGKILPSTAPS
jgi:cytochrome P450